MGIITNATSVDYFNCRQSFSPFGFNGSVYGRLLISLTKLDDSRKIVNDRFKKRFIEDIKNSGLYKELEYVTTRFSELNIDKDGAANLLKMLRRIKEITEIDGLEGLFVLLDSAFRLSATIISGGAGDVGPGGAGDEMHAQDGGGKRTIMKGGALGSLENVEINIIYHNLSSQICCSLIRNLIFDGNNKFDSLTIQEIIGQGTDILTSSSQIDKIYDMFIVIVSRYVNSLMDMKLSGVYMYDYDYNYEYDLNTMILIERLFTLFSRRLPQVQLPVILPLFMDSIQRRIENIDAYYTQLQDVGEICNTLIKDLLSLSLVIEPYSNTTDDIQYFSQVSVHLFDNPIKDNQTLLPVNPLDTCMLFDDTELIKLKQLSVTPAPSLVDAPAPSLAADRPSPPHPLAVSDRGYTDRSLKPALVGAHAPSLAAALPAPSLADARPKTELEPKVIKLGRSTLERLLEFCNEYESRISEQNPNYYEFQRLISNFKDRVYQLIEFNDENLNDRKKIKAEFNLKLIPLLTDILDLLINGVPNPSSSLSSPVSDSLGASPQRSQRTVVDIEIIEKFVEDLNDRKIDNILQNSGQYGGSTRTKHKETKRKNRNARRHHKTKKTLKYIRKTKYKSNTKKNRKKSVKRQRHNHRRTQYNNTKNRKSNEKNN